MFSYVLLLTLYGIMWIGSTWIVSRDIINLNTESKYNEINKKFLPIMIAAIVFSGYMFLHQLSHFGELT